MIWGLVGHCLLYFFKSLCEMKQNKIVTLCQTLKPRKPECHCEEQTEAAQWPNVASIKSQQEFGRSLPWDQNDPRRMTSTRAESRCKAELGWCLVRAESLHTGDTAGTRSCGRGDRVHARARRMTKDARLWARARTLPSHLYSSLPPLHRAARLEAACPGGRPRPGSSDSKCSSATAWLRGLGHIPALQFPQLVPYPVVKATEEKCSESNG